MNLVKYLFINLVFTFNRFLPFPTKTGIVRIGNPDKKSPVFLTGNFLLTVARLKRALRSLDAYLLVANSRGINIWCAAAGGHFTNHNVISILKTTDISSLVDHRKVVLPQLSAVGLEGKKIKNSTGWEVVWGPVYAKDIKRFVEVNYSKSLDMKTVRFSIQERLEMGISWGFPIALILTILLYFFAPDLIILSNIVIWTLIFLLYVFFPLYANFLNKKTSRFHSSFYDIRLGIIQVISLFIALVETYFFIQTTQTNISLESIFYPFILDVLIVLILTFDLMGVTPVYKSAFTAKEQFSIEIEEESCKGAGFCEDVCPVDCFEVDNVNHKASIPRINRCVACGACIVQCPFDALYLKNLKGETVSAEIIRSYKLNMMGKRLVKRP